MGDVERDSADPKQFNVESALPPLCRVYVFFVLAAFSPLKERSGTLLPLE